MPQLPPVRGSRTSGWERQQRTHATKRETMMKIRAVTMTIVAQALLATEHNCEIWHNQNARTNGGSNMFEVTWDQLSVVKHLDTRWHEFRWSTELWCHYEVTCFASALHLLISSLQGQVQDMPPWCLHMSTLLHSILADNSATEFLEVRNHNESGGHCWWTMVAILAYCSNALTMNQSRFGLITCLALSISSFCIATQHGVMQWSVDHGIRGCHDQVRGIAFHKLAELELWVFIPKTNMSIQGDIIVMIDYLRSSSTFHLDTPQ